MGMYSLAYEQLSLLGFGVISMTIDFNSMIDNHLAREHYPKKMGRYYPSEIGRCLRKIWYSYKYPKEVKPDLLKIFELGNILHDFVVEVLKSEKNPNVELLKYELPVKMDMGDFTISGRVDDLILLKDKGENVLVEVKSIKNIAYAKNPQSSHKTQLQFYMHASNVHKGMLLYIDKTTLQSKVFPINYNEEEAVQIVKRFDVLHDYLMNNKLPASEAKDDADTKWMCKYCEYTDRCEKNKK